MKGRTAVAMLNGILWDRHILNGTKTYKIIVRNLIAYGAKTWQIMFKLKAKQSIETNYLRMATRYTRLERIRNVAIRKR